MSRDVTGELLLFGCAASVQAVLLFKTKGKMTLPYGYRFMTALGGGAHPYIGYIIESNTSIVAAFRGTENLSDLFTDFNFGQVPFPYVQGAGMTHRGFTEVYERSVRPQLSETLGKLSGRKRLLLAGHSLGGALATLAALDAASNSQYRRPGVCTYGSPKVGNADFASAYDRMIASSWRVVNTNDIAVDFPPSNGNAPYAHVREKISITFNLASMLKNHQIRGYAEALAEAYPQASDALRKRSPGFLQI